MRIDLHTHSLASDGTQTPTELVRAAAEAGLDVVAITDHDTTAGWAEAEAAALDVGISLVRGIEISCRHRGHGVHLLAYLPDPTHPGLAEELARIAEGRTSRIPEMLQRLAALGMEITLDDVRAANPGTEVVGRPHVADALVAAGHAADRDEVFARLLGHSRPAHVDRYAAPLAGMVATVADAGGVTVVAHPWGRVGRDALPAADLPALVEAGLTGLEVDHEDHDPVARAELRGLAREHGLVVTGSSDHHGLGKVGHDLGVNTTAPDELHRLLGRAQAVAARSGRAVPEVVG